MMKGCDNMSYYVGNGCFHFKDDNRDYLGEIRNKIDQQIDNQYDQDLLNETLDCENSTDQQLDNHAIDVMNDNGYYDSSGKYRSYSYYDCFGEVIN